MRFLYDHWKLLRDVILFFSGLAGVAHQTLVAMEPSESLLVLFAGMMGLPFVFRRDEKPPDEKEVVQWRKAPIRDVFPDDRPPWMKMLAYPWTLTWMVSCLIVIVTVSS